MQSINDNSVAVQILHNITKKKPELVSSISVSGVLEDSIQPILKDTQIVWQPADFMPDPSQESFIEEVGTLSLLVFATSAWQIARQACGLN